MLWWGSNIWHCICSRILKESKVHSVATMAAENKALFPYASLKPSSLPLHNFSKRISAITKTSSFSFSGLEEDGRGEQEEAGEVEMVKEFDKELGFRYGRGGWWGRF